MTRRMWVVNSVLVVALGATIAGAVVAVNQPASAEVSAAQTATVTRSNVTATVSGSGNLSTANQIGVDFQGSGGTVVAMYVEVGDEVTAGEALARVDATTARRSLRSAQASLASAQANLAGLRAGQTSAEAARDSAGVASAKVSLTNAKRSLSQARDSYDLDRSQQDALVSAARAAYDSAGDPAAKSQAKSSLDQAERTRESTLLRDKQSIQNAQGQVDSAEAQLGSQRASASVNSQGATSAQLASARAQVTSAQVQVDQAEQTLEDTVLRAPVDGTVTAISGAVGESSSSAGSAASGSGTSTTSSSSTTGFVVLSALDRLEVVSKVAEADATDVAVGQKATVTFSASDITVDGVVTGIDVQDTVTNNVVEYGVTVTLSNPPATLKLGQTASVSITTGRADGVLSVPTSAITSVGGRSTVTVQKNGVDTLTPVQTGLEGGSRTEITSGLVEGEVVVLPASSGLPSGFSFPGGGLPGGGLGAGLGG
jgi:multidrug efflux pump subunit AcrA (membrane-fusion protein)